jgi:uncharacterized protein (TIGR02145 family)
VLISDRGVCWSTSENPTILNNKISNGSGAGSFIINLTGLQSGLTYFVRSYAIVDTEVVYGNNIAFYTSNSPVPGLTTIDVTDITKTKAVTGGDKISQGADAIIEYGLCWSTTPLPTLLDNKYIISGSVSDKFTCNITGLTPGTKYYLRAFATNNYGTGYGNEKIFNTFNVNAIKDIDSNYYNTVTIGSQIWIKENLRTTSYNDGSAIPFISYNSNWSTLTTPGYCYYRDSVSNKKIYGNLYNWYSIYPGTNGGKNVCPTGWHVSNNDEWITLITNLGGEGIAGGKLKEAGTEHWLPPNFGGTNESGFSGLAAGYRGYYGEYSSIKSLGSWWSISEADPTNAWYHLIHYDKGAIYHAYYYKYAGNSVRCIKD